MRAEATARGIKSFRYRGAERDWTPAQVAEAEARGKPYTVRLKTPLDGATSFSDLIRGGDRITVNNSELQDIVLVKSSGMPLYHLAHLVDDHLMSIDPCAARRGVGAQRALPCAALPGVRLEAAGVRACAGDPAPGWQGQALQAQGRCGDQPLLGARLPAEAMFNYLALQGWSYDDHTEIMTRAEVVERFTIDRVQASPARWNPDKLKDMNGLYIRKLSTAEVAERIAPFLSRAGLIGDPPRRASAPMSSGWCRWSTSGWRSWARRPSCWSSSSAMWRHRLPLDHPALLIPKKIDAAGDRRRAARPPTMRWRRWSPGARASWRRAARAGRAAAAQARPAVRRHSRVAITGRTVAPPLFETLAALGKQRSLARIAAAREALDLS